MLKSFVIFCALFSISCCYPSEEESPESKTDATTMEVIDPRNSTDEETLRKIDESIQMLSNAQTLIQDSIFSSMTSVLIKSFDKQCMLEEYKKIKNTDKFPQFGSSNIDYNKNVMRMVIFSGIGFLCSSKRNAILEFSFDSMTTLKVIVKAFINEVDLKKYHDMLICANNYAVTNEIIDPKTYEIQYELTAEDNQEQCKQWQIQIMGEIEEQSNSIMNSSSNNEDVAIDCVKQTYEEGFKFLLKYSFIIQVNLRQEQKLDLVEKFIDDYKNNLHVSMACFAKFT